MIAHAPSCFHPRHVQHAEHFYRTQKDKAYALVSKLGREGCEPYDTPSDGNCFPFSICQVRAQATGERYDANSPAGKGGMLRFRQEVGARLLVNQERIKAIMGPVFNTKAGISAQIETDLDIETTARRVQKDSASKHGFASPSLHPLKPICSTYMHTITTFKPTNHPPCACLHPLPGENQAKDDLGDGPGLWFNEMLIRVGALAAEQHIVVVDITCPRLMEVYPKTLDPYVFVHHKRKQLSGAVLSQSYSVHAREGGPLCAPDIAFDVDTIVIMYGTQKINGQDIGHFWATNMVAKNQAEMDQYKKNFEKEGGHIWQLMKD